MSELEDLDSIARDRDAVLGFRACESSDELEPVFLSILAANPGQFNETALVSITDRAGLSLGRYVIPRERLDAALNEAEDVEVGDPEPTTVPSDW